MAPPSSSTTRRREESGGSRRSPIERSRDWSRPCESGGEGAKSCSPTATERSGAISAPTEINDYIKDTIGEDHSAKDFRTWNATVLAAVVLAASARERDMSTKGGRNRAKRDAVNQVSHYLGNTPAVCRASYIDPRVFDRFDGGLTIGGVFERLPDDPADWPEVQGPIEEAVLDLIDRRESPAIERVG